MSSKLEQPLPPDKEINLCVGKEWYRFPSSFFLPSERYSVLIRDQKSCWNSLIRHPLFILFIYYNLISIKVRRLTVTCDNTLFAASLA